MPFLFNKLKILFYYFYNLSFWVRFETVAIGPLNHWLNPAGQDL